MKGGGWENETKALEVGAGLGLTCPSIQSAGRALSQPAWRASRAAAGPRRSSCTHTGQDQTFTMYVRRKTKKMAKEAKKRKEKDSTARMRVSTLTLWYDNYGRWLLEAEEED